MDENSDYDALVSEANAINYAHDVITSGGRCIGRLGDYEPRANGIGDARNSSTRTYSVQPPSDNVLPNPETNVASVSSLLTNPSYAHGHRYQPRHTFAPQHQKRAKELILALDKKNGQRIIDKYRADEVKKAKKVLGIAGIRIPKV